MIIFLIAATVMGGITAVLLYLPEIDAVLHRQEDALLAWLTSPKGKRFLQNGGYALIIWVGIITVALELYMSYQGILFLLHGANCAELLDSWHGGRYVLW